MPKPFVDEPILVNPKPYEPLPLEQPVAPMPAAPVPPSPELASLAALLRDSIQEAVAPIQEQMAALKTELAETKAQRATGSAFRPIKHEQPKRGRDLLKEMGGKEERVGGGQQIPVDVHGQPLHKAVLNQFRPQFDQGDLVAINPNARREGFPNGKTWGDMLGTDEPVIGEVLRQRFLSDQGEWKYSCHFPKLMARRKTDGFYGSELVAAE